MRGPKILTAKNNLLGRTWIKIAWRATQVEKATEWNLAKGTYCVPRIKSTKTVHKLCHKLGIHL